MEATNTQEDTLTGARLKARPSANPNKSTEGLTIADEQQSMLPWAAWLFEQAALTSNLRTSSKRKMSVINVINYTDFKRCLPFMHIIKYFRVLKFKSQDFVVPMKNTFVLYIV